MMLRCKDSSDKQITTLDDFKRQSYIMELLRQFATTLLSFRSTKHINYNSINLFISQLVTTHQKKIFTR